MSSAVTDKDAQDLRKLIPLNILSASRFENLCSDIGIEEGPRGTVLFSQGDAKNEFVYVLSGTVSLQAGGMEMETISGGTESARFALAHQIPRKVSAIAKDRVRYIRVDAAYVNQPNENAGGVATYEVSDMPEDSSGDWVTTLLKSPIFQRLPPANLQNILSTLEDVPVKAGQEIIHQDEPGDYYYVIKQGRCALTRKPSKHAREIKLAELKTCDTFGEDSLISDQPRNVTVTMMTDGVLLRLSKPNFLKLVKEPVIAYVNMENALRMIPLGTMWLDVRSPDLFEEGHLPGAINIPFFKLRMELTNLSRQHKYILVCETGRVSESAAFLLIRHAFSAYVLKGGISAVFRDQLVCGPDTGASGKTEVEEAVELEAQQLTRPESEQRLGKTGARKIREDVSLEPMAPEQAPDQALKTELMLVRDALAALQAETKESRALENSLREQLRRVDDETAEARAEFQALTEELARLKEGQAHTPPAEDLAAIERRLAGAEAEQRTLESDLCTALADKEHLERQLYALREASAGDQILAGEQKALQEKIHGLEELNARAEQEKRLAEGRIQELEKQVAELSAVLQEFVDQQSQGDENEELQSLRAELETVRTQASGDVMAMQARLRGADQEVARLKGELETAQTSLLRLGAERASRSLAEKEVSLPVSMGKAPLRLVGKVLYALLVAILGAVLLITAALGTDAGRGLTQKLIAQFEQGLPLFPDSFP